MDFDNRMKQALTESVIRALLVDAGYRAIDFGIESQVREVECLSATEYGGLDFPKALRCLPDMIVMDREQTKKHLVEIKYRNGWTRDLFDDIKEQARIFNEIVLVYLNSNPTIPDGREPSASSYLRCCKLRYRDDVYEAEVKHRDAVRWGSVDELGHHDGQWWRLRPLQEVFKDVDERKDEQTLTRAIHAVRGIINV